VNNSKKQDMLKIYLMDTSMCYGRMLTSLHNLRKQVINDVESATMIEEAIYALDRIVQIRQHLRDKYGLSKFKID